MTATRCVGFTLTPVALERRDRRSSRRTCGALFTRKRNRSKRRVRTSCAEHDRAPTVAIPTGSMTHTSRTPRHGLAFASPRSRETVNPVVRAVIFARRFLVSKISYSYVELPIGNLPGTSPVGDATMRHSMTTACVARPVAPLRRAPRAARHASIRPHALPTSSSMTFQYTTLERDTSAPGVSLHDLTPDIKALVKSSGITNGFVNVLSRHTTTAVTINEAEPRLMDDVRVFLRKLAPPEEFYLHNDLHLRDAPTGWPGGDDAWRLQEPANCHSHLLSMLVGNSETVPVVDGELVLGRWQSGMLGGLDGPRARTVGVQVAGV